MHVQIVEFELQGIARGDYEPAPQSSPRAPVTVASSHGLSGSAEYWPSLGSRGDRATFSLIFPRDSAVLVAGAPGAGKTTLLRRVAGGHRD